MVKVLLVIKQFNFFIDLYHVRVDIKVLGRARLGWAVMLRSTSSSNSVLVRRALKIVQKKHGELVETPTKKSVSVASELA